jgi:aminoglycoside 2'-N-acetyltransferase I
MPVMAELRIAHTADVDPTLLDAAHAMLVTAFGHGFEPTDWDNALGGIHALLLEDGEVVGHASVVQRRLLHGGRALRTGYVEGVGVRADQRRRGHGLVLMRALEPFIRRGYDLGALGATDAGAALYVRCGWQRWRGPVSTVTAGGIARVPEEDGCVYVLAGRAPLDLDGDLVSDLREGDPW